MSRLLRGLATRTSWPHSSSTLLIQGEWVPASMAMRSERSEENRRLRASGVVRSLPSSITSPFSVCVDETEVGVLVAEIQSGCHLLLPFANITHGPILLSFGPLAKESPYSLCRPQGYCAGGRPSHLIFRELRTCEAQHSPCPEGTGSPAG